MNGGRILILTNERDFAADEVVHWLNKIGADVERLNIEAAQSKAIPAWSPKGEGVPTDRTVVWWRQFETDRRPDGLDELDDILVDRAQWRAWISTLANGTAIWVNDLWAARRAENKVEQLRVARDVGFSVPATIITNDPAEAEAFRVATGPCVIKTLASAYFSFSDQSFVFTEALDDTALQLDGWHRVPVVVQALVAGGLDARVVAFGNRCYGAKCRAKGIQDS